MSKGDLFERAETFAELIKEPFAGATEQMRAAPNYAQLLADQRLGVTLVLAGSRAGHLTIEISGFKLTEE
jgi:hypothetical protein